MSYKPRPESLRKMKEMHRDLWDKAVDGILTLRDEEWTNLCKKYSFGYCPFRIVEGFFLKEEPSHDDMMEALYRRAEYMNPKTYDKDDKCSNVAQLVLELCWKKKEDPAIIAKEILEREGYFVRLYKEV